jgi:DNA-binding transcriptional ArsR family regulator
MVEFRSEQLDHVFHALSHSARREMLRRLASEAHTVSELAEPFDMSLEAVSKHVRVLERARLVRRTGSGRVRRCQLKTASLRDATKLLAELSGLWNKRLDALERVLEELQAKGRS